MTKTTKAKTESGTVYEFRWNPDSPPPHLRWGEVRKDGGDWETCTLLTDIRVGQRMVMALGRGIESPTRLTSRIVEVSE